MADYEQIKPILEKLQDWERRQEIEFACDFSAKNNKRLCVVIGGSYNVYNDHELILNTINPFEAIEKYLDL